MLIRNYGGHDKECQDCGQTYDKVRTLCDNQKVREVN